MNCGLPIEDGGSPPLAIACTAGDQKALISYSLGILMEEWGFFHSATSYDGNVYLSVLADREALTDPANYAEMMEQSFDDLMHAAAGRADNKD